MMTLGVTFDHRFMDGYHGGEMAQIFCAVPARTRRALRGGRERSRSSARRD